MSDAIYLPDNPRLLAVLDNLPQHLRPYRDHMALLIHFAGKRLWVRGGDEDDGFTRLHSLILRKYIPDRQVKPIRAYLVERQVLALDGYSAGRRSIGYRVAEAFGGLPLRWLLSDARLIRKRRAWQESSITEDTPEMRELAERRRPVTDSMCRTLDCLNLCAGPDKVERALYGRGMDAAHLRYACSAIAHHDHEGLYMDPFGWRVHSIVTHTTVALRPFLRFGGAPLIELDVRNAQPLILGAALRNPSLCATYLGNAQHSGSTGSWLAVLDGLRSAPAQEVSEFIRLCEAGQFYEAFAGLTNNRPRDAIKHEVFRDVLFGKLRQRGLVSEAFEHLWPGIFGTLRQLKKRCGYKIVAQLLQRMESTIMIDGVCGRIVAERPDVRFLTIHDAALVVTDRAEAVRRLIVEEFGRHGVLATVRKGEEPARLSLACGRSAEGNHSSEGSASQALTGATKRN